MQKIIPRYLKRAVLHKVSAVRRYCCPLKQESIAAGLRRLGDFTAPALLVHSSLSACGHIVGGTESVIEALKDWIGPASLAMPVHTYCYPDSKRPVYVEGATPSLCGAISETFRLSGSVLCSVHPSHSLACGGPLARTICEGHEQCNTPCGHGTPYARLIEMDAAALYFGATLDAATLFHSAENAAHAPYMYKPDLCHAAVQYRDGMRRSVVFRRHEIRGLRRFACIAPWLEERGLLQRVRLGRGELLFVPHSRIVHETLVAEIKLDPWFLTDRRWDCKA